MTYDDMPLFLDKLTELAIFYDYEDYLTIRSIDLYWKFLKRFDLEAIFSAIEKYQAQENGLEKMPTSSDIIRHLEGSLIQKAQKAWMSVMRTMQYFGAKETIVFDDKIIHAAIDDMGGWVKLCEKLPSFLEIQSNEFEKRYVTYSLRPPVKYPKAFIGIRDKENMQATYQQSIPVLVGDIEKAKHVYLNGVGNDELELPEVIMQLLEPAGAA